MAARTRKSAPKHVEPEDISQESPEEEPAAIIESSGSVNQAELVRKAVAAGHEKPSTGVPYIKTHFGADIDPKYYSVAKSQLKKREAKESFSPEPAKRGRKPKAAAPAASKPLVEGYVAPPEKPKAAGEPDVLLALEGVKELVQQFGADKVKRMVDLIG
jgi:hypothetical protein